tara:strand:- start:2458 stop:2571 length:114 start_codon:yes stop_codon:yes gene_type:complete
MPNKSAKDKKRKRIKKNKELMKLGRTAKQIKRKQKDV